jgi:hypothetical protein
VSAWQIVVALGCLVVGGWIFFRTLRAPPPRKPDAEVALEREREDYAAAQDPYDAADDDAGKP